MTEGLTPLHLIAILVVALLIIGPDKLPETGAALGKAVRAFRHGLADDTPPRDADRRPVQPPD
jgi:TatA/E family protein of Tat protein translocase